ncbi:hypothetical protein SCHPADRAFT_1000480 [Schizopora paradoxa]|uniref:Uncharacterized protein n=1 Tax=Schizopora paradoxa TaxID=27342 RepID=A0A0H2RB52_9AGAM|nr:hypothetical protein SCHPADRAFT_1000480 [Schizopora paradoxa]
MPISCITYMKIFALAYLMSLLISATFEDAILRAFLSIYLRWLERFGVTSHRDRAFHFPTHPDYGYGELRKRALWSIVSSYTSQTNDRGHPEVVRVEGLPASPASPQHSLSIGILAIIAGGCFLLLMSLFLGLYCCCIRKRGSDKMKNFATGNIEKGIVHPSNSYQDFKEKISTPIPMFEFSPPSPTWTPSLPTFSTAIQANRNHDRNHLRPIPPAPANKKAYPVHEKTQNQPERLQSSWVSTKSEQQGPSPSIRILINDEEHDTDAVIASSSPLMRRPTVKPGLTTQSSKLSAKTSLSTNGPKTSRPRNSGLGISTLNLGNGTPRIINMDDHDMQEGTARSTRSANKSNPDTSAKGNPNAKRDTWSRLSTAITRFSRSSLAYLVEDDPSDSLDGKSIESKEGNRSREKRIQMKENEVEKRRRRRTGMVGNSVTSLGPRLETANDISSKPNAAIEDFRNPLKSTDFNRNGASHTFSDGHAENREEVIAPSSSQGLPTLGSSSMESLLAYLSETSEHFSEPTQMPESGQLTRRNMSKDIGLTHPSQTPKEPSTTFRSVPSKKKVEGQKQILGTPTSPLLSLVKGINAQNIKKMGTSSYEAWLSNVPSPILKSPRNDGYRVLQQTGSSANERETRFESRKDGAGRLGRNPSLQSRRGLGLQLDSDIPSQNTQTISISNPKEVNTVSSASTQHSRRPASESRKSSASLPDAQEGLNKALAALDELARGLKSSRQTMSFGNGKDGASHLPTREPNASTSGSRPSRKSLIRVGSTIAPEDHRPGSVLPLQVKQKGRSTSIDVNAQHAAQRTSFISRTSMFQPEPDDYRKYGRQDVSRQELPSLGDHNSFEPSSNGDLEYDTHLSSSRRASGSSLGSASSSPGKGASQRLDWCRESLTPRFNHLARILEGRNDPPPPVPRLGTAISGRGKTKQA